MEQSSKYTILIVIEDESENFTLQGPEKYKHIAYLSIHSCYM